MPRGAKHPNIDVRQTIDAPPQAGPSDGFNCSDETKRTAYREALILKIAVEASQEAAKSKLGSYRAYLKAAAKKGVSSDAISFAIAQRMNDPDLVLIEQRERLKMLDLSGFLPGIRDKLLDRLDVQEATDREEEENEVLKAYDRGALAGRSGHPGDTNPYPAGSLGYVKWADGWRGGQRAIADEMIPDGQAEAERAVSEPSSVASRRAQARAQYEAMPGPMPGLVQ